MTDSNTLDDRIIRTAIKGLLDAGFRLSVFDGEETTVSKSTDADAVFAALRTTDEDQIRVHSRMDRYWGFINLVYGNSPGEVICDYSTGLEPYLTAAMALADIDDDACDNSTGQHTWREPLDERAPTRCISCNAEKVA